MEEKKVVRKKPKFLRTDWHKKIKLGRGVKKNQKWHGAKGRQNKFRLNRKGRGQRPKVGWGAPKGIRDLIFGIRAVRVENLKDIDGVKKGEGIIIGSVGMKKKKEMIAKANEIGLRILNRYVRSEDGRGKESTGEDATTVVASGKGKAEGKK